MNFMWMCVIKFFVYNYNIDKILFIFNFKIFLWIILKRNNNQNISLDIKRKNASVKVHPDQQLWWDIMRKKSFTYQKESDLIIMKNNQHFKN